MTHRSILLLLSGACVATLGSAQQPRKPDQKAIAHQLIASAMLREGQTVRIAGSVRDAGFMEDLAIEARKVGAQPLLTIWSERLIRRSYDEVPAKYDDQEPKLDLALVKQFDADRKSTRLNSSHSQISYAVFCLKKKKKKQQSN